MRFPSPFLVGEGGVAVFADSHLGQAEGDGEDFLAALGELPGRGFSTVVLLGDVFHYLVGDLKFETPLIRRVVGGLEELAARGVHLRYVEGNRDFFVARSPFARPFAAYGLTDGLAVGARRYAFVHGDRVNTRDLPYRFWRVLSKNPVSYAVMKLLPGTLARAVVARTEARLYRTNFKHKSRLPVEHLRQEGRRARLAGYDEVLVGHFHVDWVSSGPECVVRVLPAWLEERRHAEIDPDGTLRIVQEPTAARARSREAAGEETS